MNIIKAIEAKKIAEQNSVPDLLKMIDQAYFVIKNEARIGKFSARVYCHKDYTQDFVRHLEGDGYEMTQSETRSLDDTIVFTASWKNTAV